MARVRSDDPSDSEDWKKRQIPVVSMPEPVINGQIGKFLTYAKVFKNLGLEPILAMLFLGWLFGFWQIPVVDKYFNTMIADDVAIMKQLDTIQRMIGVSNEDRLRIVRNLFQSLRIECENRARQAKDETARANCGNIHE